MAALLTEIPAEDRGAALEGWLGTFGVGGLDTGAVNLFRSAIDAWVAEDPEAALEWAAAARDPGMRELAMTGVAGSLAGSDPQRAFDCLVTHGEFRHALLDGRIMEMMRTLSKEAAKEGPEAIAKLWANLPKAADSVNAFSGVHLDLHPATDFRAVNEALRRQFGEQTSRPIFPVGVMETWTRQDPAAARAYLIELVAAKERISDEWGEVKGVISKDQGVAAANQWTIELLRELPAGDRGTLLAGAGYLSSSGSIHELLRGASEEESALWISETLQASADRGRGAWEIRNLLGDLPVKQRIEYLKTLRGEKALERANAVMAEWSLPEAQQEDVRNRITGS